MEITHCFVLLCILLQQNLLLIAYIFQSLFSTTAFGLGGKYFAFYEEEGVGVQWNNIYISPVEDDQYNLLMVLMMMMFDAFLYAMIAWYIENVFPGKKNRKKKYFDIFCFVPCNILEIIWASSRKQLSSGGFDIASFKPVFSATETS